MDDIIHALDTADGRSMINSMSPAVAMMNNILRHDCCIGCGACAFVAPDAFKMKLGSNGQIHATTHSDDPNLHDIVARVCPFSDYAFNEDVHSHRLFTSLPHHHPALGRFINCYAGRVQDLNIYSKSSSGGITRWLLAEMLKQGIVDRIIHVRPSHPMGEAYSSNSWTPLYHYTVSDSELDALQTGKSAYYPVDLSSVLNKIKSDNYRYAITGVPCFIKAIRNLVLIDPELNKRVVFTIGIICGHLKSTYYAEMLGWQLGIDPGELSGIDFRVKIPGAKANEKGVLVTSRHQNLPSSSPQSTKKLFGTDYGLGYFKYRACEYCDDVFAETADISLGDAWLPNYLDRGTNIVITRDRLLDDLLKSAAGVGKLELSDIPPEQAALSQGGGLRDRRDGLAYRLYLDKRQQKWMPLKRISPRKNHLSYERRRIIRMRTRLRIASSKYYEKAKADNNWETFHAPMSILNEQYHDAYSVWYRNNPIYTAARKVWHYIKSISFFPHE